MIRSRKTSSERQAEIISATAAVMLRKGFKAATTREVAARIGVGNGLLNHYFTWGELRRLAFEAIARHGSADTFSRLDSDGPDRTIRRLVEDAFSSASKPYLRVWIEAMDEAGNDMKLAKSVNVCASEFRTQLAALVTHGNEQGAWFCDDPDGAAWRILAVHDGLIGFVLAGAPPLSAAKARKHFEIAIGHELIRTETPPA